MTIENISSIRSATDAIIAARQAQRAGLTIPIAPCVQVDAKTGQVQACRDLDPTLGTLCRNPDGLIVDGNRLLCPRQRGSLRISR